MLAMAPRHGARAGGGRGAPIPPLARAVRLQRLSVYILALCPRPSVPENTLLAGQHCLPAGLANIHVGPSSEPWREWPRYCGRKRIAGRLALPAQPSHPITIFVPGPPRSAPAAARGFGLAISRRRAGAG